MRRCQTIKQSISRGIFTPSCMLHALIFAILFITKEKDFILGFFFFIYIKILLFDYICNHFFLIIYKLFPISYRIFCANIKFIFDLRRLLIFNLTKESGRNEERWLTNRRIVISVYYEKV